MSAINICERCDSLMTGNALSTLALQINFNTREVQERRMDICPDCVTELLEFIANAPTRGKTVYRNPWTETPPEAPEPERVAITAAAICGIYAEAGHTKLVCKREPGHDGLHEDSGIKWANRLMPENMEDPVSPSYRRGQDNPQA